MNPHGDCLELLMTVMTETGSTYHFARDPSTNHTLVRRTPSVSDGNVMRRDDEWLRVLSKGRIEVGYPMAMMIELRDDGILTERITSPVTEVSVA